jgi:DNA-binding GntR family transcriptional regulator
MIIVAIPWLGISTLRTPSPPCCVFPSHPQEVPLKHSRTLTNGIYQYNLSGVYQIQEEDVETGFSRYRGIANALRRKILSAPLENGSKMPDERTLSEKYRVSRLTMRRALRILEEEKLIRRVQGSGTYINPASAPKIPLMIDYAGSMREHAPSLKRKLLSSNVLTAGNGIASEMNLAADDTILYAERVDFLKKMPIAYDKAYINLEYGKMLEKGDFEHIDFIEWWTKLCGFTIEYCTQNIEAVSADAESAEKLCVEEGRALLKSSEHYFLKRGVPAGFFISLYNPKYISIRTQYNWAAAISNAEQTNRRMTDDG